ncbi:MAG: TetR/AcrR family transcriptional regulator [Actinomycetota bacterium]
MTDTEPLAKRREPEQQRSRAGVAAILDAAATLLDDHGIDQITMTAIAAQAGLSKAALYRYFPNKAAIIRGLAERSFDEDAERIVVALAAADGDGRQLMLDGLRTYLDRHRSEPHRVQLRAAIRADPELARLDLEDTRRNATVIATGLVDRGADVGIGVLANRIVLILELSDGVIRLASMVDQDEADQLTEEYLGIVADRLGDL